MKRVVLVADCRIIRTLRNPQERRFEDSPGVLLPRLNRWEEVVSYRNAPSPQPAPPSLAHSSSSSLLSSSPLHSSPLLSSLLLSSPLFSSPLRLCDTSNPSHLSSSTRSFLFTRDWHLDAGMLEIGASL
jgi:hypothetical protein